MKAVCTSLKLPFWIWLAIVFYGGQYSSNASELTSTSSIKEDLIKNGSGTYRWWGIKVYDAALYVPEEFDGNYLKTRPIALEIEYDIDIDKEDLIESTVDEWDDLKMTQEGQCQDKQRWSKQLSAIWPDLKQGDSLTLIIDDQNQSLFLHNGDSVGFMAGESFANCFLSIWLANDTNAPSLRRKLLDIKRKR